MVNGLPRKLSEGTQISELLLSLKVPPERVAVELNLKIIEKDQFHQTVLREGDNVEIISFVGGGCYAG